MVAIYPTGVISPRTLVDRAGIVYNALKTNTLFAKDLNDLSAEVVAIETDLIAKINQALKTTSSPTFYQVNLTTLHATNILADHIGEHGAAHGVFVDNNLTLFGANLEVPLLFSLAHTASSGAARFKFHTKSSDSYAIIDIDASPVAGAANGLIRMFRESAVGDSSQFQIFYPSTANVMASVNALTGALMCAGNLTIGNGAVGVDYQLKFDGESNDGILIFREDEKEFYFDSAVQVADGNLSITGSGHEILLMQSSGGVVPMIHFRVSDTGADWYFKEIGTSLFFQTESTSNIVCEWVEGGTLRLVGYLEPYSSAADKNLDIRAKGIGGVMFNYGAGSGGVYGYNGGATNLWYFDGVGVLFLREGTSTAFMKASGSVYSSGATVTVGAVTTETTMMTKTLKANALGTDYDWLDIHCSGYATSDEAEDTDVRIYFGTTLVYTINFGAAGAEAGNWTALFKVMRHSATDQYITGIINTSGRSTTMIDFVTNGNQTLTSDVIIKVTGQKTYSGDICRQEMMTVTLNRVNT